MFDPNALFFDARGKAHARPYDVPVVVREFVYGFLKEDEWLLMVWPKNGLSYWELPGGGVEENESIDAALFREFLEETGYGIRRVSPKAIVKDEQNYKDSQGRYCHAKLSTFLVEVVVDQRPELIHSSLDDSDEIAYMEWIPVSELKESDIHPIHRGIIPFLS